MKRKQNTLGNPYRRGPQGESTDLPRKLQQLRFPADVSDQYQVDRYLRGVRIWILRRLEAKLSTQRADLEDVAQLILIKIQAYLPRLAEMGPLERIPAMQKIINNACIDWHRARARAEEDLHKPLTDSILETNDLYGTINNEIEREKAWNRILDAAGDLAPDERAFLHRIREGCNDAEAMGLVGRNPQVSRMWKSRIVEKLRERLLVDTAD